jgi:hypothetical protein
MTTLEGPAIVTTGTTLFATVTEIELEDIWDRKFSKVK